MRIAVSVPATERVRIAFEWAQAGHSVSMFDFEDFPQVIADIDEASGIHSQGKFWQFQPIAYAGTTSPPTLDGAELVFAVGPAYSNAHFGAALRPARAPAPPTSCARFRRRPGVQRRDGPGAGGRFGDGGRDQNDTPYAVRASPPGHPSRSTTASAAATTWRRFRRGSPTGLRPAAPSTRILKALRRLADNAAERQPGDPPAITLYNAA